MEWIHLAPRHLQFFRRSSPLCRPINLHGFFLTPGNSYPYDGWYIPIFPICCCSLDHFFQRKPILNSPILQNFPIWKPPLTMGISHGFSHGKTPMGKPKRKALRPRRPRHLPSPYSWLGPPPRQGFFWGPKSPRIPGGYFDDIPTMDAIVPWGSYGSGWIYKFHHPKMNHQKCDIFMWMIFLNDWWWLY